MANYVRYGNPWVNSAAPPAITADFLTKIEQVLIQNTGGSESGKYFVADGVYTSGAVANAYIQTISRTTIPVSVSIDTADLAPTGGMSAPATAQLTHAGFQIYSLSTTGPNVNARCGGNWTVNW